MIRLIMGAVLMFLGVAVYFFVRSIGEKVRKQLQEELQRRSESSPRGSKSRRTPGEEEPSEPDEVIRVKTPLWARLAILYSAALFLLGLFLWATTSFVIIDGDKVGHLERVFTGKQMEPGQVIAKRGQKGKQARVLAPGFKFEWFIRVLYKVEQLKPFEVKEGSIGRLYAVDGIPLEEGQQYAPRWSMDPNHPQYFKKMLDAEYFLENKGMRGPQLTELPPAEYRICQYLFEVEVRDTVLSVPAGHVAFIKSNVQEVPYDPEEVLKVRMGLYGDPNVPVVPRGYKGMWAVVLSPQQYYMHNNAYEPNIFDVRVQPWDFLGGYTKRSIKLTMDPDGVIQQEESEDIFKTPEGAVDRAIPVIIEGWEASQDVRAFVHIEPKNVPYVQAKLGGLENVKQLFASALRDKFRTVCGQATYMLEGVEQPQKRRALDLYEKRDYIAREVMEAMKPVCKQLRVTFDDLLLGDPGLPPELRLPQIRKQLADQMVETFTQEKLAQDERKNTEKSRATADMQKVLVEAEMKNLAAEELKSAKEKEGEGYKLELTARAEGEKALMDVLGVENTMMLSALKQILDVLKDNPDMVKMPAVVVQGDSGVTGGMAVLGSILGWNNVTEMLKNLETTAVGKTEVQNPGQNN